MDAFKKGLSITLAVLFVFSALAALLAFNLERIAFDAEAYQKTFAQQQFYDQLPGLLAQELSGSTDWVNLPPAMQGLSSQQWEKFIRDLLPPETLQKMGDETLSSLFDYLNGRAETVQVPLTPLKQSLASDVGVQAVIAVFRAQPDCTLAQLAQMTMSVLNDQPIALCNLPEELYPGLTPIIQQQLQWTAAALPDQMTIVGGAGSERLRSLRQRLQTIRLAMRLSPLLPLGFLFALTLLIVRSLRDWLTWWGIPFSMTGALAALMGLLGAPLAGRLLSQILMRRMPAYLPSFLLENSDQLTALLLKELLKPLTTQGLILLGVGLAMTALAMLVTRNASPRRTVKKARQET